MMMKLYIGSFFNLTTEVQVITRVGMYEKTIFC